MKIRLCALLILWPCFMAVAGNLPPVLSNVRGEYINKQKLFSIEFTVKDPENDSLEIAVFVYDSKGREVHLDPAWFRGDIGFPVVSGKNKKILISLDAINAMVPAASIRIVATDNQAPDLTSVMNEIDSARIKRDLEFITGERNAYSPEAIQHLVAVRNKLQQEFENAGMVTRRSVFKVGDTLQGENVIGRIIGLKNPAQLFVTGAHFDTVIGSPGADDNATGTAVLLEVARVLSKYGFNYTLDFVGFDMEEVQEGIAGKPAYSGSRAYVKQVGSGDNDALQGFINLDMVGFFSERTGSQQLPDDLQYVFPHIYDSVKANGKRGNFLLVISNERSKKLSDRLLNMHKQYQTSFKLHIANVPGNGKQLPDFRRADHASFWDRGYSAISLGDGAFSRNPHYHSKDDQLSDIHYESLVKVTKLLLLTLADLAEIRNSTAITVGLPVQ